MSWASDYSRRNFRTAILNTLPSLLLYGGQLRGARVGTRLMLELAARSLPRPPIEFCRLNGPMGRIHSIALQCALLRD